MSIRSKRHNLGKLSQEKTNNKKDYSRGIIEFQNSPKLLNSGLPLRRYSKPDRLCMQCSAGLRFERGTPCGDKLPPMARADAFISTERSAIRFLVRDGNLGFGWLAVVLSSFPGHNA